MPLTHVVSDFQRSEAFCEMLGFQAYWPVPGTNTEEVANAVGMPKYKVEGPLMALQNAEQPMVIDLRSGSHHGMTHHPAPTCIGRGSRGLPCPVPT